MKFNFLCSFKYIYFLTWCHTRLLFDFISSPERKRRVSSRVNAKKEPSPVPSRPSSLRQSIPVKQQPPQMVNGKAEMPAPGRTRSAARHTTHSLPSSSSSHNVTNSTPSTTGIITDVFNKYDNAPGSHCSRQRSSRPQHVAVTFWFLYTHNTSLWVADSHLLLPLDKARLTIRCLFFCLYAKLC